MRKKLFTAAMLFLAYCLVVVLYSYTADSGLIEKSAYQLGLTKAAGIFHQTGIQSTSSLVTTRSFIDPIPDPPFPRPLPKPEA